MIKMETDKIEDSNTNNTQVSVFTSDNFLFKIIIGEINLEAKLQISIRFKIILVNYYLGPFI